MNLNKLIIYSDAFYSIAKLRADMDIKHFKNIPDPIAATHYIEEIVKLELLGEGSSRKTYLLSSKYAIKIAKNPAGIHQNRQEVEFWTDPRFTGIVANIADYQDKFIWIMVELVRPLKSESEFISLTGMSFYDFDLYVKGTITEDKAKNVPPFVARLRKLVQDKVISAADATKLSSFGKTSDGRVVLLDYGLTSSIYRTHYNEGFPIKKTFEGFENIEEDSDPKIPDASVIEMQQEMPTAVQGRKAV